MPTTCAIVLLVWGMMIRVEYPSNTALASRGLYIPGVAVHAQLWNLLPALLPTDSQRCDHLPLISTFCSAPLDRCIPSEAGEESRLSPSTDPQSKPGEDTLSSDRSIVGVSNDRIQHAFIATAGSDLSVSSEAEATPMGRAILRMLWHQRLGRMSARRLKNLHKSVKEVPTHLPLGDDISHCPTCLESKMRHKEAPSYAPQVATMPYEMLSIDFGFAVQKPDATKSSPREDDDELSTGRSTLLSSDAFTKLSLWARLSISSWC
jgi:hypothetical protein